jgi:hypothetical protein
LFKGFQPAPIEPWPATAADPCNNVAHVAFDAYDRLGLRDFIDFEAQSHTPTDRCIRFAIAVADNYATLATGQPATVLPVPVFHRLECASFA